MLGMLWCVFIFIVLFGVIMQDKLLNAMMFNAVCSDNNISVDVVGNTVSLWKPFKSGDVAEFNEISRKIHDALGRIPRTSKTTYNIFNYNHSLYSGEVRVDVSNVNLSFVKRLSFIVQLVNIEPTMSEGDSHEIY